MSAYRIVQLANGSFSVHSVAHAETFHPVIGPVAEAEALYARQLHLIKRICETAGDLVIWDVGLGSAANAVTVLRESEQSKGSVRIVSFDQTIEPLRFALSHTDRLPYLRNFENHLSELATNRSVDFAIGRLSVKWELAIADFPSLIASSEAEALPKPHAVLFDAYSPAKNPAMWTQSVFSNIYRLLDPGRPCSLATYSRSTMLRVTLLLAGFWVGSGHATGEKEETTIAANTRTLLEYPLDRTWLQRVRRSTSAEPLWTPVYRQAPLSPETWDRVLAHPQFA
jgi:tRNA U34 5-methylaminomethyl-2-thiouridine-forming methyltransferase MnmC